MHNDILELQSNAESRVNSLQCRLLIQDTVTFLSRVQSTSNRTLHRVRIDERATDGAFHEVSMQNRRTH